MTKKNQPFQWKKKHFIFRFVFVLFITFILFKVLPFFSDNCIVEGSMVSTPIGDIPIEELKVGDFVWGYDFDLKQLVAVKIENITVAKATQFLELNANLKVTLEHPIFTKKGWKLASQVHASSSLFTRELKWIKAVSLEKRNSLVKVYDLSVAPPHNFFAGGLLVHNKTRQNSAEGSAIGNLRNLFHAQEKLKEKALKDRDEDGIGEYGTFVELSGLVNVPIGQSSGKRAKPAFIPAPLGATASENMGIARKGGYHFRIFLPSSSGPFVPTNGKVSSVIGTLSPSEMEILEVNAQEKRWCAFAWPVEAGISGDKAFFIDYSGTLLKTVNLSAQNTKKEFFYSGKKRMPTTSDIYETNETNNFDGSLIINKPTAQGLIWEEIKY